MIWLNTKEIARLENIAPQTVRKRVLENKYTDFRYIDGVGGNSGKVLQIALESLPQEIQDKYYGKEKEKEEQQRQENTRVYLSLTAKQRQIVDFRYNIVIDYKRFKENYPKQDKLTAFLEEYNKNNPDRQITARQLVYWQKKYNTEGMNGLVDRKGGQNKGKSSIPEEVWNTFFELWANTRQPSAAQCYKMVVNMYPELKLPSISTFRKRLQKLDLPSRTYYREGEKAFDDKCMPYISIDYSKIHSNQQWVADHHVFDVLVVDENGEVFRPWLSGWIDRKSRCIVGYVVNKVNPNSDIVLESFAEACKKSGIPEGVLLDNGKDYKVYDLFNRDFEKSIINQMGIKVTFATPYNAKAKPIERVFGTLEGSYCKLLPSYIGSDTKKRPKELKKKNVKLKQEVMQYEEFKTFVDNMIKDYNNKPHSGLDNESPLQVYKNSFVIPPRVLKNDDILNLFMQRTTKTITVGRRGVRVPTLKHYYDNSKLFEFQGQKVYVRYDPKNVSRVYVYTLDDKFICVATCEELVELGSEATSQAIKELNKKKKERRNIVKSKKTGVKAPTIQQYLSERSKENEDFNINEANSVTMLTPEKMKQAKEIDEELKELENKISEEKPLNDRMARKALGNLIKVGGF